MNVIKHLYETVFVLHPELTEEDVEANIQSTVQLLESKGAEIIRKHLNIFEYTWFSVSACIA